ncbi:CopG family transcriptional regulator [Sphingomonas sp. ID1715]|uniref:CopG family transcriptional regulator n=1 Tax=Sphingomonas sp. ID1715 TaxID=1656898 RepID=UPI00148804BC|nr:CopG family transcriptional regulator [Sphingomonas sp. ID1715]NNM77008.1 CopG family transcriptional regulator [Sphingomonas sp. ID1715]
MTIAVTTELDDKTAAIVSRVVNAQGISVEEFAADAIREAAIHEAELLDFAQPGVDDLDAGRWVTHEELVQWLDERKPGRNLA